VLVHVHLDGGHAAERVALDLSGDVEMTRGAVGSGRRCRKGPSHRSGRTHRDQHRRDPTPALSLDHHLVFLHLGARPDPDK
jgi:hypothetical protein